MNKSTTGGNQMYSIDVNTFIIYSLPSPGGILTPILPLKL